MKPTNQRFIKDSIIFIVVLIIIFLPLDRTTITSRIVLSAMAMFIYISVVEERKKHSV